MQLELEVRSGKRGSTRCGLGRMAALVGIKQLALLQHAEQGITTRLLHLVQGDTSAPIEALLALEPLELEPVVEARSGVQRLIPVADECP